MPRDFVFTKEFATDGTFGAIYAARAWLASIGCSCGSMERGNPILVARGEWPADCFKWRHFTPAERESFDGQIEPIGERFRTGGACVRLRFTPETT